MSRIRYEASAVRRLIEIGLTEAEARVYLALLGKRGEMNAKEVSEESGIPYSKVYTVLEKLVSKSLVTASKGRPTIFGIRLPSEGLSDYKRNLFKEIENKFEAARAELEGIQAKAAAEKPDIWIIKSPEEILRKVRYTIGNALKELDVALPFIPPWAAGELAPSLFRIQTGKIVLKILLSSDAPKEVIEWISKIADVRTRDRMFGGGIISDGSEVILFIASDGANPSVAVWSNHVGLVQIAKTYFDYLWASSAPCDNPNKQFPTKQGSDARSVG